MVTSETHTLTDTNMYYPFKCACPTESHIPWGSLSSQGLYIGQMLQQGKKKTATALELFTHIGTHRDNTKSYYSHFVQSDVVMVRLLNNVLHKFNIHI